MSDLVERLRYGGNSNNTLDVGHLWNLCEEAADEIELLRVKNHKLSCDLEAYLNGDALYQQGEAAIAMLPELMADIERLKATINRNARGQTLVIRSNERLREKIKDLAAANAELRQDLEWYQRKVIERGELDVAEGRTTPLTEALSRLRKKLI